jgi:hypothetical protein
MQHIHLELDSALNDIIAKWANSLEANLDDFVVVDGEEGDFGIVRYFGFDLHGNADVHLMTRYVEGGDIESAYYTEAGAEMVEHLVRRNLDRVVKNQLREDIDTVGYVGGMYPGFVADYEKAVQMVKDSGKEIKGELGSDVHEFIPADAQHGDVFKWGFRLFKVFVMRPRDTTAPTKFGLRNILEPTQFLAMVRPLRPEAKRPEGFFLFSHADWFTVSQENKVSLVEIARAEMPDRPNSFPFTATIERVIFNG